MAEHLVFGDRLDCVAVRRLVAGPLAADERRALQTHLRSCPDCRANTGMRGRMLSLGPLAAATWLRGLVSGAGTGAAPVAAKLTAVAATAGLAAGLPASIELSDPGSKPLHAVLVPTKHPAAPTRRVISHTPTELPHRITPVQIRTAAVPVERRHHTQTVDLRSASHDNGGQLATRSEGSGDGGGTDGGSSGGSSGPD